MSIYSTSSTTDENLVRLPEHARLAYIDAAAYLSNGGWVMEFLLSNTQYSRGELASAIEMKIEENTPPLSTDLKILLNALTRQEHG